MIAPHRNTPKPWLGSRPWLAAQAEVVIPVIDCSDTIGEVIELLRLQTVRCHIVLIDTGSTPRELALLLDRRADDVEIHQVHAAGWVHPSAPVAAALDLALSLCRTPVQVLTHQDCFLRRREALEDLVERTTSVTPWVGYRITERAIPDWQLMTGHTWTGLYVSRIRETHARWGLDLSGRDLAQLSRHNWDTEYTFCRALRDAGISPVFLGEEKNYQRNQDDTIDHVRSWPSSGLYSDQHREKAKEWMTSALDEARGRIRQWREEAATR